MQPDPDMPAVKTAVYNALSTTPIAYAVLLRFTPYPPHFLRIAIAQLELEAKIAWVDAQHLARR